MITRHAERQGGFFIPILKKGDDPHGEQEQRDPFPAQEPDGAGV